jgi:hypothetical protein
MSLKLREADRAEASATRTGSFRHVVFGPWASPPVVEAALSVFVGADTGEVPEPAPFASVLATAMIGLLVLLSSDCR